MLDIMSLGWFLGVGYYGFRLGLGRRGVRWALWIQVGFEVEFEEELLCDLFDVFAVFFGVVEVDPLLFAYGECAKGLVVEGFDGEIVVVDGLGGCFGDAVRGDEVGFRFEFLGC